MQVTIRSFREEDIPRKVRWINDPSNNRYLHYDLPLTEEKTARWYERVKNSADRLDCVIAADGVPCGLVGLLRIDSARKDAEYYIVIGEPALKRKGIAFNASEQLLDRAFSELRLKTVYLYTEPENLPAQNLFRKLGFRRESGAITGVYPGGAPAYRFLKHTTKQSD